MMMQYHFGLGVGHLYHHPVAGGFEQQSAERSGVGVTEEFGAGFSDCENEEHASQASSAGAPHRQSQVNDMETSVPELPGGDDGDGDDGDDSDDNDNDTQALEGTSDDSLDLSGDKWSEEEDFNDEFYATDEMNESQ
jgi:hypothetical protein